MDGRLKIFLQRIEQSKKKKDFDKIKKSETDLVKTKHADKPDKLANSLKELNRRENHDLNLHEIGNELLKGFNGVFQMVGSLVVGENLRKANISLRNIKDFEPYIKSLDENGYENGDSVFTGYFCEKEIPVFNLVNRSRFGKGSDFKRDFVEVIGDNCYIPTSKKCFIKCISFLTGRN